jgi:large subunit ribosomal protein L20
MPRVKRGVIHLKKRRALRKATKGYMWARKVSMRLGREAYLKAGHDATRGRKEKKRNYGYLWNTRINAALREQGTTYSRFMGSLRKNNILLDRKILADLALNNPETFKALVAQVK